MEAFPSPRKSDGKPHGRVRQASAWLPLVLLVMSVHVAAQEETAAVLKLREVDFFYRSSIAVLSCNDLKGRVASIFRALGAREDIDVQVNGCDAVVTPDYDAPDTSETWQSPSGGWETPSQRQSPSSQWRTSSSILGKRRSSYEQSAPVRVRLMMPVEATPEVLAELEKDKSRRELVSRVTGNPAAHLNDPIVFPAQRQLVTLSRRTIDLEPEECELLEQMSTSAFRQLDIRVVRRGPRCDRNRVSHIFPEVTVEALMPVMPRAPQITPAGDENDPDPGAPATSESEPETATEPE